MNVIIDKTESSVPSRSPSTPESKRRMSSAASLRGGGIAEKSIRSSPNGARCRPATIRSRRPT